MKKLVPFLVCSGLPVLSMAQNQQKPNVILIFSDQHQAAAMGYEGHPDVITPNFDRLAHEGVSFERAYANDGISVASRMSLFTGLYPRTSGVLTNEDMRFGETSVLEETVPLQRVFQLNGYETYAFGKRHTFGRTDGSWDVHRSHFANESPEDNYVKWVEEQGCAQEFGEDWAAESGHFPPGNSLSKTVHYSAPMCMRVSRLKENQTMEAYSAQNTIEVIRNHKEGDKPFFCYMGMYRPHQPYTPLPKYLSMYDFSEWGEGVKNGSSIKMPETLRQCVDSLNPEMQFMRHLTYPANIWCLGDAAKDERLYRQYIASYYALITEIDHWVGEVVKELDKKGMLENTIIIYAADHGEFTGAHGMIEKSAMGHNVYEETLRVPMIFYWKGKTLSGYHSSELASIIDIYPTLVEMAGLELPEMKHPLQGVSLADNMTHGTPLDREYIISENWTQSAVITKDYKLGIWQDPGYLPGKWDFRNYGNMLFDYAKDAHEEINCYDDPEYKEVRKELLGYMKEFEKNTPAVGKAETAARYADWYKTPEKTWRNRFGMQIDRFKNGRTMLRRQRASRQATWLDFMRIKGVWAPYTYTPERILPEDYEKCTTVHRNFKLAASGKDSLCVEVDMPLDAKRPTPFVVLVHGGAWRGGTYGAGMIPFGRYFASNGIATVRVEYQLNARENEGQLKDVADAVAFVKAHAAEFNIDPDCYGYAGASAGAQLAIVSAAADKNCRCVLPFYGVYDVKGFYEHLLISAEGNRERTIRNNNVFFGFNDDARYQKLNPMDVVRPGLPPMLLLHGTGDSIVPVSQCEAFAEKMTAAGNSVEIRLYDKYEHGFCLKGNSDKFEEAVMEMLTFLKKYLND